MYTYMGTFNFSVKFNIIEAHVMSLVHIFEIILKSPVFVMSSFYLDFKLSNISQINS